MGVALKLKVDTLETIVFDSDKGNMKTELPRVKQAFSSKASKILHPLMVFI